MTPITQTFITLICMIGAYLWGKNEGFNKGIIVTTHTLIQDGVIDEKELKKILDKVKEDNDE